ncbi:MAG: hypothetical protein LUB61_06330 [Eggerthellaceae bacterium]|nr:hypothetical protein [Eggerthellaceae bacterium]
MFLDMDWSISTIILLAVIIVLAVLAIRRIVRRGMCDCKDHIGNGGCKGCHAGSCSGCSAAQKMIDDMNRQKLK